MANTNKHKKFYRYLREKWVLTLLNGAWSVLHSLEASNVVCAFLFSPFCLLLMVSFNVIFPLMISLIETPKKVNRENEMLKMLLS